VTSDGPPVEAQAVGGQPAGSDQGQVRGGREMLEEPRVPFRHEADPSMGHRTSEILDDAKGNREQCPGHEAQGAPGVRCRKLGQQQQLGTPDEGSLAPGAARSRGCRCHPPETRWLLRSVPKRCPFFIDVAGSAASPAVFAASLRLAASEFRASA
jgi:hypothetical protein